MATKFEEYEPKYLFEELGYKLIQDDDNWRCYLFEDRFHIDFHKPQQTIHIGTPEAMFHTIDLKELQAINKQVEELGWINK